MEIAFLLLLTVSLTTAGPLKLTPKRESEVGVTFFGTPVQPGATGRADKDAPPLKVVPFHSEGKRFGLEPLKQSALILRLRRALQRGCQLGTCQLHNLANTLYHINKTNGKEESTKAHDPQGYGR